VTDSPAPAAIATAGCASTASLFSSAVMAISVLSLVPLEHAEAGTTGGTDLAGRDRKHGARTPIGDRRHEPGPPERVPPQR